MEPETIKLRVKRRKKRSKSGKIAKAFDRRTEAGPLDIVAPLHGCGDELEELLLQLGYQRSKRKKPGPGALNFNFKSPAGRKAVFLGDITAHGSKNLKALSIVRNMVETGNAFCVAGDHDLKLLTHLRGIRVAKTPGFERLLRDFKRVAFEDRQAFRTSVLRFLERLPTQLIFDGGNLVVAHAGITEQFLGNNSKPARQIAVGGADYNWQSQYRGSALIVYGAESVPQPDQRNNTLNINTSCIEGGTLSALQYPDMQIQSVFSRQTKKASA